MSIQEMAVHFFSITVSGIRSGSCTSGVLFLTTLSPKTQKPNSTLNDDRGKAERK